MNPLFQCLSSLIRIYFIFKKDISDCKHHCIKSCCSDKISFLIFYDCLDLFIKNPELFHIAPVNSVLHRNIPLFQHFHQTAVAAAVSDHHRSIILKYFFQNILPLALQPVCLFRTIQRIKEDSPVQLCDDRSFDIQISRELCQKFMIDNKRFLIRV